MSDAILSTIDKYFPDEESCMDHLERLRWNGIVISPFSPNSKVYFCKENKYKCRDTGKYFNAKTNTIFHNSRIPLKKWFLAIWILALEQRPTTSVEMARRLGITQKSAWYMMQKIIRNFGLKKQPYPKRKISQPADVEVMEVLTDSDKLKMIEWLQMLKK